MTTWDSHALRFVQLAVGVAILGCADRLGTDDELAASESGDSTESESSTESDGSTDSSGSTDSTDSTESSGSSDSTESESSTDSTESTESTDSTDGMLEEVTYIAQAYVGQIDRMFIYRLDPFTNTCAKLSLAFDFSPNPEFPNLVTPMDWSLEYVRVWEGLGCEGSPGTNVFAIAGAGLVQFNDYDWLIKIFPCNIDVDAQFDLDGGGMVAFEVMGLVPSDGLSDCG